VRVDHRGAVTSGDDVTAIFLVGTHVAIETSINISCTTTHAPQHLVRDDEFALGPHMCDPSIDAALRLRVHAMRTTDRSAAEA
jgi:hypothetical protein